MALFDSLFNEETKAGKETLLLIVNLDEKYCDPVKGTGSPQTQEAAKRVRQLVNDFRKAGVTVCATYVAETPQHSRNIRFSEYTPAANDLLICHTNKEVIILDDPALTEKIKAANIHNILICGTSFNTAVKTHALAAQQQGFNVSVVSDMTGNENTPDVQSISVREVIVALQKKGISIDSASTTLQSLKK